MVKRRRRKTSPLVKAVVAPIGLGFFSITSNVAGQATQGLLPAGTVNPLTQLGGASARFVGPLGIIGLTGVIIQEVGKLKPRKRRKKR